jgi:hypothetical protein
MGKKNRQRKADAIRRAYIQFVNYEKNKPFVIPAKAGIQLLTSQNTAILLKIQA